MAWMRALRVRESGRRDGVAGGRLVVVNLGAASACGFGVLRVEAAGGGASLRR